MPEEEIMLEGLETRNKSMCWMWKFHIGKG